MNNIKNTAQCTNNHQFVWIVGTLNLATDALLLTILLPLIFKLKISAMKKCFLIFLFGSGILVMVATALNMRFTIGGDLINLCLWCMIGETVCTLMTHGCGLTILV